MKINLKTPSFQRGKFIAFEGLDGTGKTTQVRQLRAYLQAHNQPTFQTREPSEGPIGAMIRQILWRRITIPDPEDSTSCEELDKKILALLFAADRLDHIQWEIEGKLQKGVHVISDRYVLSSLAYQSVDCSPDWIEQLNRYALPPDLTIFIDTPPEVCYQRICEKRGRQDSFETLDRLKKTYNRYQTIIASSIKSQPILVIDGNRDEKSIFEAISKEFQSHFIGADNGIRPK